MKVTIEKELDIKALFHEIAENIEEYDAVSAIGLTIEDITPELLEEIFDELAEEAAARVHADKRIKRA